MKTLIAALALVACGTANAGCVVNASLATQYELLDSHTILLKGPVNILIKTFAFMYAGGQVKVLKDSFCSYENAVLYVNGEVVDAQSVEEL